MASNNGQRKTSWNKARFHHAATATLSKVDAFVVAAVQHQRCFFGDQFAHLCVIGFGACQAGYGKVAGQAHLDFQEMANTAGIGFVGHHTEVGGAKKVLRHRAPQVPDRLDGAVLFALDKRLGVQAQQLAQLAQKLGGAVQADRCLQIRPLQRLAQHASKFAVHANIRICFHQARHIGQMAAQREHHVHFCAYALHQAANLGQVAGAIEGAVAWSDDVHAGTLTDFAFALRHFA